ncbi:hypothetical protein Vretifemale_2574, partial [Volvox reticuliferus]
AALADAAGGRQWSLGQAEAAMRKVYSAALTAARKVDWALNLFEKYPDLNIVKDYHSFIPPENVMYMQRIEEKIGGKRPGAPGKGGELQYASREAFLADFKRIYDNCMLYNEPGKSPYNFPDARKTAANMLSAVDQALKQRNASLEAAVVAANSMEHWLGCGRCRRWRRFNYPEFIEMRLHNEFWCGMIPRRNCAEICDYCHSEICTCGDG